jgi:hypothetical protein
VGVREFLSGNFWEFLRGNFCGNFEVKEPDQFMNRRVPAEMSRFCVEKLRNIGLLRALFALIRNLSPRHALDPELIRDSLMISA